MSVLDSTENEVASLRQSAQELARSRKESLTTAHLLVAMASVPGPVAALLQDRRLTAESLARLARASADDSNDLVTQSLRRATSLARTSGSRDPSAIHLLLALLRDRQSGAFRALSQSGVDLGRLRASATAIANGLAEPRRTTSREIQFAQVETNRAPSREPMRIRPTPNAMLVPVVPSVQPGRVEPPVRRRSLQRNVVDSPAEEVPQETRRPSNRRKMQAPPKRRNTTSLASFELNPGEFPILCAIGANLSLEVLRGKLEPAIGRDRELEQLLDILAKRKANNPCVLGLPGVGKSTLVRGLATRLTDPNLPVSSNRVVVEITMAQLVAGTAARGSLAERMGELIAEVGRAQGRVILVLDDLAQLVAADAEAVGNLRNALLAGSFPLVVSGSHEDYRRLHDADPALAKCFTCLELEEPTTEQAERMIEGVSVSLAQHHGLEILPDAIQASVEWSVRYMPGRALPDKALSVLDLTSARCHRRNLKRVARDNVAEVVAQAVNIPVERLLETDKVRMLSLETLLSERVVGHQAALKSISTILRRNAAGLRSQRPIGSFLLLGPTGVGKTETAKAIAEALFHSAEAMTRLDFSEFAEPHALARLIGSPPGYVGYEAGGQLTEAVRRRPYQVLLLDEFEKAHRDVQQAFLQVLDEGRMTDGRGRTVDLTNTVVVMTSNLGAREMLASAQSRGIGFAPAPEDGQVPMQQAALQAARTGLAPEFYNRIDEVLYFASLTREDIHEVASRLLKRLAKDLAQSKGIILTVDARGISALLEHGGYDPTLGARPIRRAIARWVEAPLAELLLRNELRRGHQVELSVSKSGLPALSDTNHRPSPLSPAVS